MKGSLKGLLFCFGHSYTSEKLIKKAYRFFAPLQKKFQPHLLD
jgi:hypothetical protein